MAHSEHCTASFQEAAAKPRQTAPKRLSEFRAEPCYNSAEIVLKKALPQSSHRDGFTAEEDEIILEFAAFYTGPKKWQVILLFISHKSADQIFNRWMKLTENDFRLL